MTTKVCWGFSATKIAPVALKICADHDACLGAGLVGLVVRQERSGPVSQAIARNFHPGHTLQAVQAHLQTPPVRNLQSASRCSACSGTQVASTQQDLHVKGLSTVGNHVRRVAVVASTSCASSQRTARLRRSGNNEPNKCPCNLARR